MARARETRDAPRAGRAARRAGPWTALRPEARQLLTGRGGASGVRPFESLAHGTARGVSVVGLAAERLNAHLRTPHA